MTFIRYQLREGEPGTDLKLERILQSVQKPGRYVGGEYGQTIKAKDTVDVRVVLCFPDTYEIGMSNLGMRIIYGALNAIPGVWCERAFAPWGDMERQLRENSIALYALESGDPLCEFDIIAFSIGYELSYTNVLNMLDLAKVALRAQDRPHTAPLVIAGGACCCNPEPLSDFIDLFVIGDGEEVIGEIIDIYRNCKNSGSDKHVLLQALSSSEGVYVPSLYSVDYNASGTVDKIIPQYGAQFPVAKRIVKSLDDAFFPTDAIVPSVELVHDRVVLELFRGCIRGCRFCQAGYAGRPVRARSREVLTQQGIESLRFSGYDEIALLSLSSSDYGQLPELCDGLLDWCEPRSVSISLPSLRADNFSLDIVRRIQKTRKSGLTFAPEAGSRRLRDVINKNVTEEDLLETCRVAFEGGWNSIKLYFMLGLPTETDEDVVAIADLARAALGVRRRSAKSKDRAARISVSTSFFVPKPHTPFQWEEQISMDEYLRRVNLLRDNMRTKAITYSWHSPEQGYIEAALARGDRQLGAVVETAWRLGARLDSWSEHFSLDTWLRAFGLCGLDPDFYARREREHGELLPWSVVSMNLHEQHLWREREEARKPAITPDCSKQCSDCGACIGEFTKADMI